jgi:hypothetical protein
MTAESDTKPKVATLADLAANRAKIVPGPSGLNYHVRPLNLERHALAGGLPAKLVGIASKGAEGVNELFDPENGNALAEHGDDVREYLDRLVADVLVEPEIPRDAEGRPDPDTIDLVPPMDYRWLVSIAMGEEDYDGEGRRMWGREPLSAWATFRTFHGCDADCSGCSGMVASLSADHGGSAD